MSADAAEFVVKRVQVCVQEPHHLQAEITVFAQKLQELLARNEGRPRLFACFSGDPLPFAAHAFAQSEHRSRTDNLHKLLLALTGRQQDPHLAALHQVNARRHTTRC
jgi:hypothetical protein